METTDLGTQRNVLSSSDLYFIIATRNEGYVKVLSLNSVAFWDEQLKKWRTIKLFERQSNDISDIEEGA